MLPNHKTETRIDVNASRTLEIQLSFKTNKNIGLHKVEIELIAKVCV